MGMPKALRQLIDGLEPVTVTDSAVTLAKELHANRTVNLSRAAGIAVTLPAAVGSGVVFKLRISTAISSNSTTVKVANATDVMTGFAYGADDDGEGATGYTWKTDSGDDTVTMNGAATGGEVGDTVVVEDVASGFWQVTALLKQSGGSEQTPFSATVS